MAMPMAEEQVEEVLAKSGQELFLELMRLYSEIEVEDYYKGGQWKDDAMRTDYQLFRQHRLEAGAPPIKPLEEMAMPDLPTAGPAVAMLNIPKAAGVVANLLAGAVAKPAIPAITKPASLVVGAAAAPAVAPAAGAASDLKELAMFVAKFKLDPLKTKAMLGNTVTAPRRKYVMTNFKTDKTGAEATTELEQYIKECDASKKWDAATPTQLSQTPTLVKPSVNVSAPAARAPIITSARPAGIAVPAVGAGVTVKRAIITPAAAPGAVIDANKRPRLTIPAPAAAAVRPLGIRPQVAVRPAVAPAVRPGVLVLGRK